MEPGIHPSLRLIAGWRSQQRPGGAPRVDPRIAYLKAGVSTWDLTRTGARRTCPGASAKRPDVLTASTKVEHSHGQ